MRVFSGLGPQLADMPSEGLVLEWEGITLSVKNKTILQDVSGSVSSGEMLASELSSFVPAFPPLSTINVSHGAFRRWKVHHTGCHI